jgi:hypothetical protein
MAIDLTVGHARERDMPPTGPAQHRGVPLAVPWAFRAAFPTSQCAGTVGEYRRNVGHVLAAALPGRDGGDSARSLAIQAQTRSGLSARARRRVSHIRRATTVPWPSVGSLARAYCVVPRSCALFTRQRAVDLL